MSVESRAARDALIILAACSLFVLLGWRFIPCLGINADEALFTNLFYWPSARDFRINVFHHDIALMVMPYIGTLKTFLYWPILRAFAPGPVSLRFPMVIAGAFTILLFWRFAELVAGRRAALLAALLLSTDPIFLLTDTFDWGPVALEHLLLVAACLAVARERLAAGGFLFGLALWNKVTFAWALAGLAAGAGIAYGPAVRRALADRRRIAWAGAAFLAGALPLAVYNIHLPVATLRSTAGLSVENMPAKLLHLKNAVNGSGLFLFIAAPDWEPNPKSPASLAGRAAAWMRGHLGDHRSSLFPYAILLALAAAPWWWRSPARQAGILALVFCIVTFLAMAVTRDAGAAIHHTVLLWPMPHLLAGIGIAAIAPRRLFAICIVLLVASNLFVIGQYFEQLQRNGPGDKFTDAVYPLANSLSDFAGQTIYVIDWGIDYPLQFLSAGRLNVRQSSSAPFREIEAMLSDPRGLFIDHVRAREVFPGVRERLDALARAQLCRRQTIRTVPDSRGRPVFEVFRFRAPEKPPPPPPPPEAHRGLDTAMARVVPAGASAATAQPVAVDDIH